jgi:hypothetical protein
MGLWKRRSPKIYGGRIVFEKLEERIVLDGAVNPNPQDDAPAQSNDTTNITNQQAAAASGGTPPNPAATPDPAAPLPTVPDSLHEVLPNNPAELNVILVSNALQEIQSISQAAQPDAKVIEYDAQHDDLSAISQKLTDLVDSTGQKIDTLAVVGHGLEGTLSLGSDRIDISNLDNHALSFESLAQILTDDAQIQFYACSVAANEVGQSLLQFIAIYTGADVFGSVDTTGGPQGDWDLEYASNSAVLFAGLFNPEGLAAVQRELGIGPPVVTTTPVTAVEDAMGIPLGDAISISEPDGEDLTAVLTVNTAQISLLSAPGGAWDGGAGTLTLTGTAAVIDINLESLSADLCGGFHGTAMIAINVTGDVDGGGSNNLTITVNDAPVLTGSNEFTPIYEDPASNLGTPVSALITGHISDADGPGPIGIAVTAVDETNGQWQYQENGTGPWIDFDPLIAGDHATLLGPGDRIRFVPNLNWDGTAHLYYRAWDQTAGYGLLHDTNANATQAGDPHAFSMFLADATIMVKPVNDAPIINLTATESRGTGEVFTWNAANLNAISITDVDSGADQIAVRFVAVNGDITLEGSHAGLTLIEGAWSNATSMLVTGALGDINTALGTDGLTFAPPGGYEGTAQLLVYVSDFGWSGMGGVQTAGNKVDIQFVTPAVEYNVSAPVNYFNGSPMSGASITMAASTPEAPSSWTFNAASSSLISIVDDDDPAGNLSDIAVKLVANQGTITLSQTTGLVLSEGDGENDQRIGIRGTISAINAALDGMVFKPTTDYISAMSPPTLTIMTSDLGTQGWGAALTDGDMLIVNLTGAPNAAPVIDGIAPQTTAQDTDLTFSLANGNRVHIMDDAGSNEVEVRITAKNGTLDLPIHTNLTLWGGGSVWSGVETLRFKGTLADITTALDNGLIYTPNAGFQGYGGLTVVCGDQGYGGPTGTDGVGGIKAGNQYVEITVGAPSSSAPNQGPSITAPYTAVTADNASITWSGGQIAFSDPDWQATDTIGVSLRVYHGALTFADTTGLYFAHYKGTADPDGANDTTLFFGGTVQDVTNALNAGLTYTPDADYSGGDILFIWVGDGGNRGSGPAYSDSHNIDIWVHAENEAPQITAPATHSGDEDTPIVFNGGQLISVADVDAGSSTLQVTLTGTQGTISLPTTSGLNFSFAADTYGSPQGDGTDDATMTFRGSLSAINAALAGMSFLPTLNFNGAGASLSISVKDLGHNGMGGNMNAGPAVVDITVNPVNDAPVLDNSPTRELSAVNEDNDPPSGGALLWGIISGSFTDADGDSWGIAITAADTTNGAWEYSIDSGTNWYALESPTESAARLLQDDALVRFLPVPNYNGTVDPAITYRAWDRTQGINGGTWDIATNGFGGSTAFSVDVETASVTVNAVNDTPTVETSISDVTVDEDAADTVFSLYPNFQDVEDADNLLTYTVVNNTNPGLFAGVNITDPTNFKLVYAADANGTADITIRATDTGGLFVDDTFTVTVNAVNDAPVMDTGGDPFLTPTNEDVLSAFNPGTQIASIIAALGGTGITDADAGAIEGIAVTYVENSNGAWEYTIDNGTNWYSLAGVSDTSARLFRADDPNAYIRFQPNANWNGTVTDGLGFRAWDVTIGTHGALADVSVHGGTSAFSDLVETASIQVIAANDAPVITAPASDSTTEDVVRIFSPGNGNAISISDVDAGAAVVQVELLCWFNGTLSLSNPALVDFGFVADGYGSPAGDGTNDNTMRFRGTLSNINAALDGLQYTPDPGFNGDAWIQVNVNDLENTPAPAQTATHTFTLTVNAVNDAPTVEAPISDVTVSEDAPDTVFSLYPHFQDAEDTDDLLTYTVVGNTNPGLFAEVYIDDPTNFKLVYAADANGTADITIRATDTGGLFIDDTFAVTVNAVNDAPVFIAGGVIPAINEDIPDASNTGTLVADMIADTISDPDGVGALYGIAVTAADPWDGVWQYSLDNGTSWTDFGAVSGSAATLLAADASTRVRFVPDPEYSGVRSIGYRAWDQTSGMNGDTGVDVSLNGGTTAFSTVVQWAGQTINAVNDAPVVTVGVGLATDEDTPLFFAGAGMLDVVDVDAATGQLEVTLHVTNATLTLDGIAGLTFTLGDGTSDSDMIFQGLLSDIHTALHGGATGMRLDPTPGFNGTVTFDITVNDLEHTPAPAQTDFESQNITVNAVNDAPVFDTGGVTILTAIGEDNTANFGNTVAEIVASAGGDRITDPDPGSVEGIAIMNTGSMCGTWQYSLDNGETWNPVGPVDTLNSLLLRDADRVRFVPDGLHGESAMFDFCAWDQTSGTAGSNVDVTTRGGSTAFSTAWKTAGIVVNEVNDAPTVTTPISDVTVGEDAADTVLSLYPNFQDVEDADNLLTYTVANNTNPGLFASVDISDPTHFTLDYLENANGTAVITVRATDTGGLWVEDTFFTVTINPINDEPVAGDFAQYCSPGSVATVTSWAFSDPTDAPYGEPDHSTPSAITIQSWPGAGEGTLYYDANHNDVLEPAEEIAAPTSVPWGDAQGGRVHFQPDTAWDGASISFTYTVWDFESQSPPVVGLQSLASATVTITPPPSEQKDIGGTTQSTQHSSLSGTTTLGSTQGSTVGETPSITGGTGGIGGGTGGTDGSQPVAGEPTLMAQQGTQPTGGETQTSADQAMQSAQAQSDAATQEAAQQAATQEAVQQAAAQQAAQTPAPTGVSPSAGTVQTPGEAAAAGQQGAPGAPTGPAEGPAQGPAVGPAASGPPTIVAGASFVPPPLVNPSMMSGTIFQATTGTLVAIDLGGATSPPTFTLDQGSAPGLPRPSTPAYAPSSSGTTITMDQAQSAVDNCTQTPASAPGAEGLFGQ